jgi:hypothetical protein
MNVVRLYGEMNDPKRRMRSSREITAQLGKQALPAQARKAPFGAERDVKRMVFAVVRPCAMGNSGPP